MIINVAHTKGGVGKTTIAINLAVDLEADLLDLDLQNSSILFSKLGDNRKINFIQGKSLTKPQLDKLVSLYRSNKDKMLVVDSGGYDSDIVRYMIANSDIVITPMAPSQVELFGLKNFDKIIKKIEKVVPSLKSYILFTRVTQFQKADIDALRQYLITSMPEFNILKSTIGFRKGFSDAYAQGKSVTEYQPKSKAALEMTALVNEVKSILEGK